MRTTTFLVSMILVMTVFADDVISQIRSSVSSVVLSLPERHRRDSWYLCEFGFPLKRHQVYRELVGIVSNNQETVCLNFSSCATNEISRLILLAAWWGGDDDLYISGLSRCLDMAMTGSVTRAEFDWYRSGHRNMRRGNILALRYNECGMSNLVMRLYGYTGQTNACQRILSGEARTSVSNYLDEISHTR